MLEDAIATMELWGLPCDSGVILTIDQFITCWNSCGGKYCSVIPVTTQPWLFLFFYFLMQDFIGSQAV